MASALSALAWLDPEVKAKGSLKLAWKHMSGWSEVVPTQNRIPVTKEICELFALKLIQEARRTGDNEPYHVGVALLFGFDTEMRKTATAQLLVEDISLPGDLGNFSRTRGLVHSKHAPGLGEDDLPARRNKKRRNRGVTLDNNDMIAILRKFVHGRDGSEKLSWSLPKESFRSGTSGHS